MKQTTSDTSALQKDPDEWKTGDEPMTAAQRSYLETLTSDVGESFDENLTKPLVIPNRVQRIVFGGGAISLVAYILMRSLQRAQKRIEVRSLRAAGELR